jgi:virginiamycin B lyase
VSRKLALSLFLILGLLPAQNVARADVREFALQPGARPFAIAAGPDGGLWFTELGDAALSGGVPGRVGRIGVDGSVAEYALPGPLHGPTGIAVGSDGNLWFTDPPARAIGRISPAGNVTLLPNPVPGWPMQIANGPDGGLWFPGWGGGVLGRVGLDGSFSRYPVPGGQPTAVAAGADGAIWYGAEGPGTIARMTTPGEVTLQVPLGVFSGPDSFVLLGDTLWAADANYATLRALRPDGSVAASVPIPAPTGGLVVGPDRALWFTERTVPRIGRWTRDDGVTEFAIPSGGLPYGIAAGPDGGIWFTELTGDRIGRIDVPPDRRAPHAVALAASGRHGRIVQLRYRAWDDRGSTRERVSVLRGTTRLWSTTTAAAESGEDTVKAVSWKIPARISGTLRVSVQAWDAAGNASALAWSTLRIR